MSLYAHVKNLLIYIFLFPIIGSLFLSLIPASEEKFMRVVALNVTGLSFTGCLLLFGFFHKGTGAFQYVLQYPWFLGLNLNLTLGVDGISIFFLLLTTLLIPLCILASWNSVKSSLKEFLITFLVLEFFLIGVFCTLDLVFFYIFFESVLIPMFLIIGIWGSRERKVLASYYFFLYTLFGSVLMLLSVLYIYWQVGTTDYQLLLAFSFSEQEQKFLWFTFFLAFASKIPMIPVHLWLPEAHVEAPTAGSVILAGVLLKLGTYGFIRFSLPLFPQASFFFTPLVYAISASGVVYTSFTAIRQTDFKRIIAYTSIAHMNLVILGVFSFNTIGIEGAIFQSLSHGFVASALFLIIGVVYDRYRTRIVRYYGGLTSVMPIYATIFLFFTMANISFPGTSSFVGEFLILTGSFKVNTIITILSAMSIIIGGAYSLWLFNRIVYGNLKTQHTNTFLDISAREFLIFLPLISGTFIMGIYPDIFLNPIHMSVNIMIELLYF
jgi:proton-translocating NADH-quinone oxidoreductase chain M|uniref:NADH-ubiquinone oxidoreductase chain 4 n=1 Tax=Phaeodactylum tricornutum TaxID=2850 RepID=F1DGM3_PHATR|nr:NADH dehydrogenase subunit 4 [Phaeodactylum tricornutum]ADY18501.1 NADH dehydrogenase subunit 4 [Phaeodactylum tricornutum]